MFPILDLAIVGLGLVASSGLRVAQEYERGVEFELGRHHGSRSITYLQRQVSSRSITHNNS